LKSGASKPSSDDQNKDMVQEDGPAELHRLHEINGNLMNLNEFDRI